MAGTKEGGRAAAATNKARYGSDFYINIGAKGGKKGHTGGFYATVCKGCKFDPTEHRLALCAGSKGGTTSRRSRLLENI